MLKALEFAHWVNRIFGNWDAYAASLPDCIWIKGDSGWFSTAR